MTPSGNGNNNNYQGPGVQTIVPGQGPSVSIDQVTLSLDAIHNPPSGIFNLFALDLIGDTYISIDNRTSVPIFVQLVPQGGIGSPLCYVVDAQDRRAWNLPIIIGAILISDLAQNPLPKNAPVFPGQGTFPTGLTAAQQFVVISGCSSYILETDAPAPISGGGVTTSWVPSINPIIQFGVGSPQSVGANAPLPVQSFDYPLQPVLVGGPGNAEGKLTGTGVLTVLDGVLNTVVVKMLISVEGGAVRMSTVGAPSAGGAFPLLPAGFIGTWTFKQGQVAKFISDLGGSVSIGYQIWGPVF